VAASKLIRHGTEAGYKAEMATGDACERCRAGHRVYQRQFSKAAKAKGIKYGSHDVIDNLDNTTRINRGTIPRRAEPTYDSLSSPENRASQQGTYPPESSGPEPEPTADSQPGPSLSDRIRGIILPDGEQYVNDDQIPEYLHFTESDPQPPSEDGWSDVSDEEFVINAAGMRKIEDSLGTYLSVIGMTVEMVDPYCGPIIAANMENMVIRWSKVIAHYPKAAHLFLDQKGGTLMTWIGALQATWPVLYALYEHHLSNTVKVEDGRVMRFTGVNGNGIDPMMPPMQDQFNYSAE
jgi:hypothetical protein